MRARPRCLLALALLLAAQLVIGTRPCLAADGQETGGGRRTGDLFFQNLGRTVTGLASGPSVTPLVIGSAATALAIPFDGGVRRAFAHPDSAFGRVLDKAGSPLWNGVAVGGLFVAGQAGSNARFRAMTYDLACAAIVNAGLTTAVKWAVRRTRPNGRNRRSFPSGHTSHAVALAAVIERYYGLKGGAPAYAVAAAIGVSRIVHDEHALSDVTSGATLGYLVGTTAVRVNGEPRATPSPSPAVAWSAAPLVAMGARGLTVSLVF